MKILATLMMLGVSAAAFAEAPKGDASFLEKAAQGQVAEIESGQLAQNKATTDAIKQFGAMLVEHHTAARDKIESVAKRKSVELPTTPTDEQRETMKALQATDGPRFDAKFLEESIKAHENTLKMLKAEISTGRDAETKALAQQLLPTVESHLREAYRLSGKDASASQMPK